MLSILNKAWLTCGCGETIYPSKVLILIRYTHTLNVGIVIKEHYIFYVYGYNKILLMNF